MLHFVGGNGRERHGAVARLDRVHLRSAPAASGWSEQREADYRAITERQEVVEFEFEGGPLAGRRLTGPSHVRELGFYGFDGAGAPLLAARGSAVSPLGCYRFQRAYDCDRTWECVVVMRWEGASHATTRFARGRPQPH